MTNQPPAQDQAQPADGFTTGHEMRQAMKDSKQRLGDWTRDKSLMQRIQATPKSIQQEI